MQRTKIPWAHFSWNPVTGCDPVGEGCKNCYAARTALRLRGRYGYPAENPFSVTVRWDRLEQPLKLKRASRIFLPSMGDLFHPEVPRDLIKAVHEMTVKCPQHRFLILTKRPGWMSQYTIDLGGWPSNVWLGFSAWDQQSYDSCLSMTHDWTGNFFVSLEPLLGSIDISAGFQKAGGLKWVIVGGESGPGARPMDPQWADRIQTTCALAEIPFFLKSWGEWMTQELLGDHPGIGPSPFVTYRGQKWPDGRLSLRIGRNNIEAITPGLRQFPPDLVMDWEK